MTTINLSKEHIAAVNRSRNTVVNIDTCNCWPPFTSEGVEPHQVAEFMFSFIDTGRHNIDSVWWCFNIGNEVPYPSKVLPGFKIPKYRKWLEEGVDILRIFINETRKRGLEVFCSHRMNEIDAGSAWSRCRGAVEMLPIKEAHPDWLIRAWPWSDDKDAGNFYLWNYAREGVRDLILRGLRELAENYDLDGIDMDFCRGTPFFPVDQQWEHHEKLTDFVRSVRLMSLEIEQKRGRPLLLSARVPQNIDGARTDGFDLETWAGEGLVDIFVLGSRSIEVDLAGFRRITAGTNIKLYPCYDSNHNPDGYGDLPIEVYRGLVTNWLSQGADGIQTFNFVNVTREACEKLKPDQQPPVVKKKLSWGFRYLDNQERFYAELGRPELTKYKNKTFVIGRRGGGLGGLFYREVEKRRGVYQTLLHLRDSSADPDDWITPKWGYSFSNMLHQLPASITNKEGVDTFLTLPVGDDVPAEAARVDRIILRILLSDPAAAELPEEKRLKPALVRPPWQKLGPNYNIPPETGCEKRIEVRVNGVLLGQASVEEGWLAFGVKPEQLTFGGNLIGIRARGRAADTTEEIRIEKVELEVKYR